MKDAARFILLFTGIVFVATGVVEAQGDPDWSWWATGYFALGAMFILAYHSWWMR